MYNVCYVPSFIQEKKERMVSRFKTMHNLFKRANSKIVKSITATGQCLNLPKMQTVKSVKKKIAHWLSEQFPKSLIKQNNGISNGIDKSPKSFLSNVPDKQISFIHY